MRTAYISSLSYLPASAPCVSQLELAPFSPVLKGSNPLNLTFPRPARVPLIKMWRCRPSQKVYPQADVVTRCHHSAAKVRQAALLSYRCPCTVLRHAAAFHYIWRSFLIKTKSWGLLRFCPPAKDRYHHHRKVGWWDVSDYWPDLVSIPATAHY